MLEKLEVPIIQGGMGVGVSLSNLAGHVMLEGGMGVISAAHPGYNYPDFEKNSTVVNRQALKDHAQKAREISQGKGMLAVNIMVASRDYEGLVKASVEAGYDAIISGAGLPLSLPEYTKGSDILLAPIVSSGKAIKLILKSWDSHYQKTCDFVVIEGYKAGGHLGFKLKDLQNQTCEELEDILPQVKKEVEIYEKKYNKEIPIFVAGGIYTGKDIAHFMKLGAAGVQMGTRFIATEECDAHPRFKEMLIEANEENIVIVKSPTGFPGRAVLNNYMKQVMQSENQKITNCLGCLKPCNPANTPYCISRALIEAVQGKEENGLFFTGVNGYRLDRILTVKELINELVEEMRKELICA
ncbi:MAG: nitronate monooxygenase family protein [Bacillota bacterium]|nr:nitronate monooxygenase family protein [Bacillota bacterium]